jgi:SAM-dependent methyltransferase
LFCCFFRGNIVWKCTLEFSVQYLTQPLYLPERDFRFLFGIFGPSLGIWRAAEIAALREQTWDPPILDLGAGDGFVTSCVLSAVAIGLDPDAVALEQAQQLKIYQCLLPQAMEAADLPPGSVGTVLSNSVLEHVPHIDAALAAAARVLRSGGHFIFTTPTEAFSRWLFLPSASYAARRNRHFQHLNLWPVEEWDRRLSAVGLKVECVRPLMRRAWVWNWDALELLQMVYIGRTRLFGRFWRRLPASFLYHLSRRAARVDLSSPPPGGGRLMVARKV